MIKGTRFFSRRLLPLLLAAVMLLGMLPALTLPVLALPVLAEEPTAVKLTTVATEVTSKGKTGDNRLPAQVVNGNKSSGDYYVVGNDQDQVKNTETPMDPAYWLQLNLGKKYSVSELKLWIYYDDNRYLNNLIILAADDKEFTQNARVVWNADKENFFGLGAGANEDMPPSTAAGYTVTLPKAEDAQYLRFLNKGNNKNQGAHWVEIEVYGTDSSTPVETEETLYNVALKRPVTVKPNGSGSGDDRPASLITDGDHSNRDTGYTEINKDGKYQTPENPSYAQIDLQGEYPIRSLKLWNYWDRTLNGLVILLSKDENFSDYEIAFSSDKDNYFKLKTAGTEDDRAFTSEGQEFSLGTDITARYIRIMNVGHSGNGKGGHYIELEAWSTEKPREPEPEPYQFRDVLKIPTYSYTAQGGQAQKAEWDTTHPDVIDFAKTSKEGGKWGGYRYWMALTPNQDGYSQYENPCLAASDDGVNWVVPNGINNPLSDVEHEPAGTHNCDTDLVYNPDSDELWVYYVWERDQPAGTPSNLRLIRVKEKNNSFEITSTTDGKPYESLINSQYRYDMQSPAVVRRNANTWLMWSNNSDSDNSGNGWQSQVAFVELRTSTDGKNWTNKQSLADTLVLKGTDGIDSYIPWHLDVQWVEGQNKYWGLFCAYPKGGNTNRTYLLFGTSEDGKTWTTYPKPLLSPRDNKWDNNFIYRSTFIYDDTSGTLQVWYSGGKSGGWRIAYTEFENFLTDTLPTLGEPYTPGTPTPPPAGEWIDVNPGSGDIKFDDVWAQGSEGWKNEGDTDASCYKQGSKATLCFYGTAVQWIGQQESCFGEAVVTLDGQAIAPGDVTSQYVATGNPQGVVLYSVEDLPEAPHVLTIEPKNEGQRHTVGGVQPYGGVQITKLQYKGPAKGEAETGAYSITPDTINVGVGQTAQIDVLLPFNAKNTTVNYVSAAEDTARVSNMGLVTGAAAGETTVTVTPGVGTEANKTVNVTVTAGGQSETWVRVQETAGNITYSEGWVTVNEGGMDGGSAKQTSTTGATAEFKFTGTGFRWIGQRETNYGEALVYVDGVPFAYVSANGTAVYKYMLFQINGLTNGEHTVKIEAQTLRAGGGGNDPGVWLELDALEYYTGTKPLNTEVTSVALRPSEHITMDVGAETSVLATAMNADRVAVHGKALQYSVEDTDTAELTDGENGLRKLTGKKAGATKLTASLTDNNAIKAERTVTVLSDGMQETPRMPVDEANPLLLVSIYAQTKKQDWWGSNVPKGVPAQGNLSVTGVWDMIPDDLKPHTAIQLHGDDFIGHGYGGYGDHDALWAWYTYFVEQAEAYNATQQDKSKHINLYLTLMTGGTPISYLDRTIPDAELLKFLDDHECIKGVVLSENHNNGNTVGVAKVTAKYLKLMAQKGCYLVLTDIDKPNANMMEKWFNDTDELYNAAKKYHKYLVINSKSTSGSGFNTVRSFALGTWLAGLADNWGALTDAWAWYESGFAQLFKPNTKPSYEDVRRVYTFPEPLFAMTMLQCYANGAVVFNAEHPFYCTGVNDKASWVLKESILPAFRYIVQHPAADRDTVAAQIKAGIFTNGQYLPANYVDGLYGNQWDSNFLQTTGRYRVLPIFTKYVKDADVPAHILNNKLSVSDFRSSAAATRERLKGLYREHYTGTAYAVELYGSESRWLVMNSSFNENNSQDALIEPKTATFATQMELTLTPHTYLVTSETDSAITIDLNNFRADKDELWVSGKSLNSTDWATVSPDGSWNGDVHRHVTEYMAYHIDNPQLDKRDNERHDLRDTVIKLTVKEQPTATVTRVGQGSTNLADNAFYTETYENGVYTLTITHNGQVNVTIRKGGAQPAPSVTGFQLTTNPSPLTSAGGKAMLTLTGTNLPDGTKFYWGTNQNALTAVDTTVTADARSATVDLPLPANTGENAVTYYFRYSLDGTTLAGELTATVPGTGGGTQPTEPSVTDYTVAPTELPSNGGMITVTLTGTNLQNGIQIKAGTISAKTSGDAAEQTATLTLPANYSSSSVSYTVQYSLNGTDWFGGKTVRVSGHYTPPVGPVTPSVPTKPSVPERDPFPFTDVSRSSWYYDSVRAAWEKDLIDGVTRTLYKPDDTLTVAQAIKLSAALHQMLNNNGKVTLRNGSPYWYSSYVSYAVDNGIIEKMYLDYTPGQMNTPVKRNEFVHIFYGAMSDYRQINTVADNKIPDVITTDTYALEIYTFYRAGILTGSDKNGTFYPTNDIKRSEVAAILSRMYDKTARKTVSLP